MLKQARSDLAFWLLLLINAFCIYYYHRHPDGFPTIVWLYWIQSVLIGFFNFLDLLTVKKIDSASMTINGKPIRNTFGQKGCAAFFFLFHYQFFHLVYAVFVVIQVKGSIDVQFLKLAIAALLVELTLGFVRNKRIQNRMQVNYGQLFFMPYLRIIPMHLMILLPSFLGLKSNTIFLVLKLLADVGMYLLTLKLYQKAALRAS